MSIWERVKRIFRAERAASRSVGDLQADLDETYRKQVAALQQVRRGVADVSTSRKRVQLKIAQARQQGEALDAEAAQAAQAGDDDRARSALRRKLALEQQIGDLDRQHTALRDEEQKLTDTAMRVEQSIEDFRTRKDTLSARYTAASARSEINSATSGISSQMGEVGQALRDVEQHTRELEAKADAIDELRADGIITGPGESEAEAFDRVLAGTPDPQPQIDAGPVGGTGEDDVERRLQQLKKGGDDGTDPVSQ